MKRILVPTDFSKLSHHAVDFAAHLARAMNAEVSVIHFEELPLDDTTLHLTGEPTKSGFSEDSLFNAQLFRANKMKLKELATEFSKDGTVVTGQQMGGGFLKGIRHYIDNHGADLVVIGTTGQESIQEFFSGNHTEQLIEHLNVPVLSVQEEVDKNISDIVMGLDLLDEHYSRKAFSMIKTIAEMLDAKVHIVNIIDFDKPLSLEYDSNVLAKEVGLINYVVEVITAKNENEALMNYADQVHAGLIVSLSEARSGLNRFFQHSFATKLTKTSHIPVLTVNKRNLESGE